MNLSINEARKQLNSVDNMLEEDPVIFVTRHGKPVFAFVETEYLDTLIATIEICSDPRNMEALEEARKDITAGRLHDHDDVEREFG